MEVLSHVLKFFHEYMPCKTTFRVLTRIGLRVPRGLSVSMIVELY